MRSFSRINNITGWLVFSLALGLYLLTMEPTVSLWDCGEFLSAAWKLEVGHPPGAPFYLMLGRIFSLPAPDERMAAMYINALSAIASAFTVLFLFWTITHLARKIFLNPLTKWNIIQVIGSGVIGSLSFCFSDSFWFSATEAEVYALSSLFTALVFWCILKWEEDTGVFANRWLILIAYLMGLSIGIHLLNLLAIPAIGMVYYFRKFSFSRSGAVRAFLVSFILLLTVLYILIPGIVWMASWFELILVNRLNLPVNAGLGIFMLIVVSAFLFLSRYFHVKGKLLLNTIFLCLTLLIVGYSSYAMIVIRADANTPINTGDPSNAFSLLSYLNRDQYGNRPLIYGPYYNAPVVEVAMVSR